MNERALGPALRLTLVTDAWHPQVNGVVNTFDQVVTALRRGGDSVTVIAPDRFRTVPCPTYPEIELALPPPGKVADLVEASRPDAVHIATEGPLGLLARRDCLKRSRGFTTSYHTKFPEYLAKRLPLPLAWSYAAVRRFHNAGRGCMVATPSLAADLSARGFRRLMLWPRGVDTALFRPRNDTGEVMQRPVFLCVGRVAVEKNIEAFLALDLPGAKVVVGDGPARAALERAYPDARFLGALRGEALARAYAAADVFVFPSRTDTFGNVILEALASGLPVAAYPVTGPKDIITSTEVGVLDEDLRAAALGALALRREAARRFAEGFSWETSAAAFRGNLVQALGLAGRPS